MSLTRTKCAGPLSSKYCTCANVHYPELTQVFDERAPNTSYIKRSIQKRFCAKFWAFFHKSCSYEHPGAVGVQVLDMLCHCQ